MLKGHELEDLSQSDRIEYYAKQHLIDHRCDFFSFMSFMILGAFIITGIGWPKIGIITIVVGGIVSLYNAVKFYIHSARNDEYFRAILRERYEDNPEPDIRLETTGI